MALNRLTRFPPDPNLKQIAFFVMPQTDSAIKLQYITADEWQIWKSQRLAALKDAPYAFSSRFADWEHASEEQWRTRLSIPDAVQLIAYLNDETAVGMVAGIRTVEESHIVELISLWVSPAARGCGVGDALIAGVEKWCLDMGGVVGLRLEVRETNTRARALYYRHGFLERGSAISDSEESERVMFKELRSEKIESNR